MTENKIKPRERKFIKIPSEFLFKLWKWLEEDQSIQAR